MKRCQKEQLNNWFLTKEKKSMMQCSPTPIPRHTPTRKKTRRIGHIWLQDIFRWGRLLRYRSVCSHLKHAVWLPKIRPVFKDVLLHVLQMFEQLLNLFFWIKKIQLLSFLKRKKSQEIRKLDQIIRFGQTSVCTFLKRMGFCLEKLNFRKTIFLDKKILC